MRISDWSQTCALPISSNDEQYRAIRRGLLATPFETFERETRQLAARSLTGTAFDPAPDIVAICVNRWSHGFATALNDLFDKPLAPGEDRPDAIAGRPSGRIALHTRAAGGVSPMKHAFNTRDRR